MKLVVATHNEGKLPEIMTILRDALGQKAEVLELISAGSLGLPDPVETGVTFEENALLKARDAAVRTGLPAVADDSGLIVDVLGCAPGILSARWSGVHGDDKANVRLLLAQLGDIPDGKRSARFCCAAALVVPTAGSVDDAGLDAGSVSDSDAAQADLRQTVRIGEMIGSIVRAPRGSNGFGYDPIFVPDDQPSANADMDAASGPGVACEAADADRDGGDANVVAGSDSRALTSAEMSAGQKNAISHRRKAFTALAPVIGALLNS